MGIIISGLSHTGRDEVAGTMSAGKHSGGDRIDYDQRKLMSGHYLQHEHSIFQGFFAKYVIFRGFGVFFGIFAQGPHHDLGTSCG
jgi:hypothetical protein